MFTVCVCVCVCARARACVRPLFYFRRRSGGPCWFPRWLQYGRSPKENPLSWSATPAVELCGTLTKVSLTRVSLTRLSLKRDLNEQVLNELRPVGGHSRLAFINDPRPRTHHPHSANMLTLQSIMLCYPCCWLIMRSYCSVHINMLKPNLANPADVTPKHTHTRARTNTKPMKHRRTNTHTHIHTPPWNTHTHPSTDGDTCVLWTQT